MKLKELLLLSKERKFNGFFVRGNQECGELIAYWPKGNLYEHCFYLKGRFYGEYKSFWYNGQKNIHCFYSKVNYEGVYKRFNRKGELIEHELYAYGKLVKDYLK